MHTQSPNCRRTLFLETLQRMKERHRNVRAHGKSWQQSCAKSSEKSIQALSEEVQRSRRNSVMSSSLLMTAFVALLLVFLSRQEGFQVIYPPTSRWGQVQMKVQIQ